MHIARVIGTVVSTIKHKSYNNRKLLLVQRLELNNEPVGYPTIAIDYVGAGVGDYVLVGSAPGLASTVFKLKKAPMRELIMGIIDKVETSETEKSFGNSYQKNN